MAIKDLSERPRKTTHEIDLSGPEGNAYHLLAYAKGYAQQLDMDFSIIRKEMESSDYDNLIKTFDKYFGSFVTLYK